MNVCRGSPLNRIRSYFTQYIMKMQTMSKNDRIVVQLSKNAK